MKAIGPFTMFALMLVMAFCATLSAQPSVSFGLLDNQVLDAEHKNSAFGGVSAIESIPANVIPGGNSVEALILFSDHADVRYMPVKDQRTSVSPHSYFFSLVDGRNVSGGVQFFDLSNVECVRYSKQLQRFFYNYETDYETGIAWIQAGGEDRIAKPIYRRNCPIENRGIEGIAITSDYSLWCALESGEAASEYVTPFVRIPFKNGKHDEALKQVYQYPFDKYSCLDSGQYEQFGSWYGNGVSEILDMPDKLGGGLLVMERCWDGSAGFVRLYIARIDGKSKLLTKELVFDFSQVVQPDNLEGMAWGPDEGSDHILYVVSDDNYNWAPKSPGKAQKTQLIRLRVGLEKVN